MSDSTDWPFFEKQPEDRHERASGRVNATPLFKLLGLTLDESDTDFARVSVEARPELANPNGITHGGIHATLIDTAIGQALTTTIKPGWSMVTIEMDVKYFKPTSKGRLIGEGRIVRKGKRIAHGEVDLKDERGELLGKGWCVYAIVPMPAK